MNLKVVDKNEYLIYLNNQKLTLQEDEDLIRENIKKIIITLMKAYKIIISGFYKVIIYNNNNIGNFIEMKKIEGFDTDGIDLKIILFLNSKFFLATSDYDVIKKYKIIYFSKNTFYVNIDEINKKDLLSVIEHGKIIYGQELEDIFKQSFRLII